MRERRPAFGAETDPLRRARQLQRSWERLLADGNLGPELPPGATAGLRPTIVESWRRSLATGLDPTDLLAPIEADESEVLRQWFEHPLGSLSHVLMEHLQKVAEESRGMVVVTDASGLVLHRVGDEWLKERAAEMNLVEGARYSEAADGTNGIGTALTADHAFQVFAFEHFNERHHQWVCSGVPVHDPVSGQTIGLIDLSTLWNIAHPRSLELVTNVARTIEQCLVDARRETNARLRRRYSDFMTRSTDLLVDRDGHLLDGTEAAHPSPLDIPEGGGEVVLGDGSVAMAAPLGRGEAYLLRQGTTRHAKSAPPVKGPERAEERARELAAEQAALRQVATLVARESSPEQLFAVVAEQVARILNVPHVRLVRYEQDGSLVVGGFSEADIEPFPIGSRWPLDSPGVTATVRQTGRPARLENYEDVTGQVAAVVRSAGMHSAVASPIVVERHLWGSMVVLSPQHEPLPEDTEARLTDFTELVATAIANAESRVALGRLADEQAAFRRVATLVAQEVSQAQVFDAIATEAMQLLRTDAVRVVRYEGESGVVLAGSGEPKVTPPGFRFPLDGETVAARIFRQEEPARQDDYAELSGSVADAVRSVGIRSVVGVPVLVEGRLWGAITTGMTREEPLPPDTESRLGEFTALMATAISNSEARAEVERLADEQAALRRVATLVARDVRSEEIFAAVSEEVSRLLVGSEMAVVVRFEDDERPAIVFVGVSNDDVVRPGTRWELEESMSAAKVFRTGRSARSRVAELKPGPAAETVARLGILSTVASPITVEGRLWGAVVASGTEELPLDTEDRVEKFTELVATAIANAESGEARAVLTGEQAALRRVATLVAGGAGPDQLFAAVADEVQELFGAEISAIVRFDDLTVVTVGAHGGPNAAGTRAELDPDFVVAAVRDTGRAARFDTDDPAASDMPAIVRETGARSAVANPIVVEGKLWGAIVVGSRSRSLPPETERRLADFTELIATAVANTQARQEVTALAEEQAALRRVAVLVAQQPSPGEVFTAVTQAVGLLLDADLAVLHVFPGDGTAATIASWSGDGPLLPIGTAFPLDADNLAARIFESGAPARMHSYDEAWEREASDLARSLRVRSAVGAPILVEGKLWGALMAATRGVEPWAENAETRIAAFTELVTTAISNAESREALAELADEQAALRRVATLVAQHASPQDLFEAVAEEVGRLLPVGSATMGRFDPDDTVTTVASWNSTEAAFPTGGRWPTEGTNVAWMVLQTGRPARIDDFSAATDPIGVAAREAGMKSAVGSPIVVEGDLWGVMTATSSEGPLPPGTEARLASFTELVATAIANAEARHALERVATEQATLRRIATLVARSVKPEEVFAAVTEETAATFRALTAVMRFEHDPPGIVLVGASKEIDVPIGTGWDLDDALAAAKVYRSGRSARVDRAEWSSAGGPIGEAVRQLGIVSTVASPIIVEGTLWGVITVNAREELPPDTEQRLEKFTDLVTTAIANAEGKSELAASRRRIVAASDEARRRIERDLHDGIQQRLVALTLRARALSRRPPGELPGMTAELAEGLGAVADELREVSRGIHPTVLTEAGLGPALRALGRRSGIPIEVDVTIEERLAVPVEVAAYYVASEALTNAAKHSQASVVELCAGHDDGLLTLEVRDDGVGGAEAGRGSGIVGLTDRVEALGGTITITSPPGGGTTVSMRLPTAPEGPAAPARAGASSG